MQILQFDAPSRRIIGFWTENPFHPRRFAVVELTRTQQPAWMYCDLRVDLLDQETANAVEAADSKSLFYGCAGGPWRMLQPSAATAPMGEAR